MGTEGAAGKIENPLKGIRVVGKTRPIGEMAYVSLKGAIVRGDLHPGQRLVESALSAQMGISRIPVREAIKKLEQDGLIEKLEKGGFIVKNPSRKEIEETFGIRACIESYAAALATGHMDAPTIDRLENVLRLYRDALERRDIAKMTQLNNQLDEIIFSTSGSRKLYALIANFRDFISRYRKVLLTCMEYAAISLSEHEEIVQAMKEGDVEGVEKLVRKHLLRGRDILIKDMESGRHM
ncbi:MAG: GntR family transcriptional regulator [Syntrophorhabdales bacterium]